MARNAWWICGLILGWGNLASAEPLPPRPSPVAARLVAQLGSERFAAREEALARLVGLGLEAAPALLEAARSNDLEVAQRAGQALELICQSIDGEQEAALRTTLTQGMSSPHPATAGLAGRLLKTWPQFRHHYAAARLELLGAEIVDFPAPTLEHGSPFPPGAFGGGFFGGMLPLPGPIDFEDRMGFDFDFDIDAAPEFIAEEEVLGPIAIEFLEAEDEDRVVLGGERLGLGALVGALRGLFGAPPPAADEGDAPVEFLEPPAEAEVLELGEFFIEDFDGEDVPFAVLHDFGMIVKHGVVRDGERRDSLPPGTMRLGSQWIGGDEGLRHVSQLQGIHTVILSEAAVTDAALQELKKLASLRHLHVERTALTSAALRKFRSARRQVEVTAQGNAALGISASNHAQGVRVNDVFPESGARRAGIAEQDIVTKVADQPVRSVGDIHLALYDKRPGETIPVEYLRRRRAHRVDLVLGEPAETPVARGNVRPPIYFQGPGFELDDPFSE